MKKISFIVSMYWPLLMMAQSFQSQKGIEWNTNLSWEQVKQKAKQEKKYIFVDYFATWCGPCKQMDKSVFNKAEVGKFYNEKFICVKVQSDKTMNDNEEVRMWYSDAEYFRKNYKITALPSFLFFNSNGAILKVEEGFVSPRKLIEHGEIAMSLKKYYDPNKKYNTFLAAYEKGEKNYKQMPEMIRLSLNFGEYKLYTKMSKDYLDHISGLSKKKWYNKATIEFLSTSPIVGSASPFFGLFYPNGDRIDAVMKKKGYASSKVKWVIDNEISTPFLNNFYKGKNKERLLEKEPSWDTLKYLILEKYNDEFATIGVLKAKCDYYRYINNVPAYINTFITQMQRRDINNNDLQDIALINECAWFIFLFSNNKNEIELALEWMKNLTAKKFHDVYADHFYDTYANLMFKYCQLFNKGQIEDALSWEQKALKMARDRGDDESVQEYQKVINKMINRNKKNIN
jgi:thioredoxin-related protein